jgi:thiamine-phosphate pyrophosphorylase
MIMRSQAPRLYLTTPRISDPSAFAGQLDAALAAGDVACVLLQAQGRDDGETKRIVRTLAEIAARHDVALLVDGDPQLATRAGADGVHIRGAGQDLSEALESLKPERIVGCGGLELRDDAMTAGEAGADYVMFGDAMDDGEWPSLTETIERTSWWAEIFNVPCVALARRFEDIGPLADAGADFVALGDWLWNDPRGPATLIGEARALLADPGKVTG